MSTCSTGSEDDDIDRFDLRRRSVYGRSSHEQRLHQQPVRTADNTEPVLEAATGELPGQGASATTGDVDEAVVAARAALPGWRSTLPEQRGRRFCRLR